MIARLFKKTNCKLIPLNKNLINKIWKRKNSKNYNKFYKLNDKDSGESSKVKSRKF